MADIAIFGFGFTAGLAVGLYCKKNNIVLLKPSYEIPILSQSYLQKKN